METSFLFRGVGVGGWGMQGRCEWISYSPYIVEDHRKQKKMEENNKLSNCVKPFCFWLYHNTCLPWFALLNWSVSWELATCSTVLEFVNFYESARHISVLPRDSKYTWPKPCLKWTKLSLCWLNCFITCFLINQEIAYITVLPVKISLGSSKFLNA